MKKAIALVCAMILAMSMAVTAFAAPSVTADVITGVEDATDKDGKSVKIIIEEVLEKDKTIVTEMTDKLSTESGMKDQLGDLYVEGMQVVGAKEVRAEGDVELLNFPVTVKFNVKGVTADSKVVLLHYTGNAWEVIEAKAGDGTAEAAFDSLSPVIFVADADDDTAGGGTTGGTPEGDASDDTPTGGTTDDAVKTGDDNPTWMFVVLMIVAAVVVGGVVVSKKRA